VFLGLGLSNFLILILALGSLFGTTIFTFWLYNRVAFGAFRFSSFPSTVACVDVSFLEFLVLFFLTGLTVLGGLCPFALLGMFDGSFFYYFV